MEYSQSSRRRLIEDWLPINELSVDAVREGGGTCRPPALESAPCLVGAQAPGIQQGCCRGLIAEARCQPRPIYCIYGY